MTPKILFVDDDPAILRSYKRYLSLEFDLDTALGGEHGLQMMSENGPYAVVVSDMRMPGMDGGRFLSEVHKGWPDSVRILLTGHAHQEDVTAATSKGQLFGVLDKPCPPDILVQALRDAIEHHRRITEENKQLQES